MFENHTKRGLKKLDLMVTLPMVAMNMNGMTRWQDRLFYRLNFSILA